MSILILEASTTSAKAMLYDGGVLAERSVPFDMSYSDVVTQDAECVFQAVIHAAKEISHGADVEAVAVSGTWHSLLVLDKNGSPKTRAFSWAYTGAADKAAALRRDDRFAKETYRRTGCMIHAIYPAYKLLHLKEQGLAVGDGERLTGQGSYIFFRLTGELVSSLSMASGSGLLNINELVWDEKQRELCGLKCAQLPDLVTHEDCAPLSAEAAKMLGLERGIPVVPAHPDGALNQVGVGALGHGKMTLSVGTSGALRVTAPHPRFGDGIWCYYAPGTWLSGAATSGCTNCVDWLQKKVLSGQYSYAELEKAAAQADREPIFMPFLFGERCPGWHDARTGGFTGLSGMDDHGTLYRAVILGVSFNLFQCYEIMCAHCGVPDEIHISGGIMRSEWWLRLMCSLFGHDMRAGDNAQASMLGAACLGIHAAGRLKDISKFPAAENRIVKPDDNIRSALISRYNEYVKEYSKYS